MESYSGLNILFVSLETFSAKTDGIFITQLKGNTACTFNEKVPILKVNVKNTIQRRVMG